MDGVDVFKLFASDFGTVNVFAGERIINMMMMMIQDDDELKMCRSIFFFLFSPSCRLKVKSKSNANFHEKKIGIIRI